jgi:hypothetical protein
MRTTSGVSFLMLLLGAFSCSSKSTKDDDAGGNGGIVTAGSSATAGSAAQAGSSNAAGGTTGNGTAGTSNATAGTGTAPGCADTSLSCLDAETASRCNPDTLMQETFKCSGVEDLGPGLTSSGCVTDADGSGCVFVYEDEACHQGSLAFAACGRAANADVDELDAYFLCVSDTNDAHTVIPCFSGFVDQEARVVDCDAAEAECFPDVAAGGAGGAGG